MEYVFAVCSSCEGCHLMQNPKSKLYPGAVIRKILAAFLLAGIAISLALGIARFSFRELMGTVEKLTEPNEKLTILNSVFEEITTLDQLQRAEAINNPRKPYQSFLEQSTSLYSMIDSLRMLPWDTNQFNRLTEMKEILAKRNKLFFSYLKVKADLLDNKDFAIQLDTLSAILQNDQLAIDSSTITTQRKITTTYLQDTTKLTRKNDQTSLLKKLFSNKKKNKVASDTPRIKVMEELSVVIDTIAIARQNDALLAIERIMRELEADQRAQKKKLQRQELELIHANSLFINQLLNILHDVENEELQLMRSNNDYAVGVMNQSISRINILMLSFFLGAALLVYLIGIDISKSNYYKEQLEKARDEAEKLTNVKQRFLANMSHEIRTPLQSIIGFAEQLKKEANGKDPALNAIYSSSEHLLQIVNEVLDYSRISFGTVTLAHEKFRLITLIREVESAMRIQAEGKNLSFILDNEVPSEYILTGDPFRLRQILYNVISNAIKFTHKGFVKLSLKTIDEGQHVLCIFEVTDSGIGINKEDIDKIFNQFEQANADINKHYGGTGLGLTIVKMLVDAHEGRLEVTSEPESGSSFRIELRFEKTHPSALTRIHQSSTRKSSTFTGKVMIIDDDPLILRLCSLILKKNNIEHFVFNDAQSILTLSYDPAVSHIFLDIRMPDMNGVDLCHSLRQKYSDATRFIALTAQVLPEEKENLLAEGFDCILNKPFHEQELMNVLGISSLEVNQEGIDQADLSMLRKMTLGDESLFQSIVAQFIEESGNDLRLVKEKIAQNNPKALREIVHKLAGRFAQLGVVSLSKSFHSLEEQLVAGKTVADLNRELGKITKKANDLIVQIRLTTIEQLN